MITLICDVSDFRAFELTDLIITERIYRRNLRGESGGGYSAAHIRRNGDGDDEAADNRRNIDGAVSPASNRRNGDGECSGEISNRTIWRMRSV